MAVCHTSWRSRSKCLGGLAAVCPPITYSVIGRFMWSSQMLLLQARRRSRRFLPFQHNARFRRCFGRRSSVLPQRAATSDRAYCAVECLPESRCKPGRNFASLDAPVPMCKFPLRHCEQEPWSAVLFWPTGSEVWPKKVEYYSFFAVVFVVWCKFSDIPDFPGKTVDFPVAADD